MIASAGRGGHVSSGRVSVAATVWALACLSSAPPALCQPSQANPPQRQTAAPLLRALIVVPDNAAVPVAGESAAGVEDAGVPALATPAGRRLTRSFLHRPIGDALIDSIQTGLRDYYQQIKRPFVAIAITDAAPGVLVVRVTETRIGAIRVVGNQWFDASQYLGAMRDRPGDPFDTGRLFADLDWINRNPNRQAKLLMGPGAEPGTYDLTLRAQDNVPIDATVAADNDGTNQTGLYRVGAGLDWTNALWRGDDLSYNFMTSLDNFRLREHVLSYTAWFPWRDYLTITGALATTASRLAESPTPLRGQTDQITLRYTMPLPALAGVSHRLDIGYDFKSTNSNLLSGGSQVFASTSEIDQFVIDYGLQQAGPAGSTALLATLVGSPGGLSPDNAPAIFDSQQPGATPGYVYGRFAMQRVTNLPRGLSWEARLGAQIADADLLPSEQLIFGGATSIRGFVEQGALRDEGVVIQNELRLAPISTRLPDLLAAGGGAPGLVPFLFLDLGAGRNHTDLPGIQRSWLEMVSAGPGVIWDFSHRGSFRFTWGAPLVRDGRVGPRLGPAFNVLMTF